MPKTKIDPRYVKNVGGGGWAGWQRLRVVGTGNLGNIASFAAKVKSECSGHKSASEARMCLIRATTGRG